MSSLSKELRNQLARVTLSARTAAEAACRSALENLAVHEKEYRPHMTVDQRQLRNRLRARGRALGDALDSRTGQQEIKHLAEDAAYEHWHRLLFTRFLAENALLHTDAAQGDVPVTLEDCEELAPELGAKDGFDLACRFAERTLPGVFRSDDPIFELNLAQKDQVELRHFLNSLPKDVFTASDSLGWTYQFWQAQRKDEVNASGNKIGADELPAVTQLFTEDYMVDFLLDNTLGAWHAAKKAKDEGRSMKYETEAEARAAVALPGCEWKYLRLIKSSPTGEAADSNSSSKIQNSSFQQPGVAWSPAAGMFEGWPRTAAALRLLDPCMGSGHFVVAMFERLVALRMAEEKLDEKAAVAVVIRDNLFGLELDPRCTQIAAFNLALAAWRRVGHCALPAMNLACSGLAPNTKKEDWLKLAGNSEKLRNGMERLYKLFEKAPVLGSLINPRHGAADMYVADYHEVSDLLQQALEGEKAEFLESAVTAQGIAKAAEILAGQFTLVATNVPYLGRGKQDELLKDYCEDSYPESKADLATCFVERCLEFCSPDGATSLVTPHHWLFLSTYKHLRRSLLGESHWNIVARLDENAFDSSQAAGAFVGLFVLSQTSPATDVAFIGIECSGHPTPAAKANELIEGNLRVISQAGQKDNPDCRVSLDEMLGGQRLQTSAAYHNGIQTGDYPRFGRCYWEVGANISGWKWQQTTVLAPMLYGGRSYLLRWDGDNGEFRSFVRERLDGNDGAWIRGLEAWGKLGILVSGMRDLPATTYEGMAFDNNATVVVLEDKALLPALWVFCESGNYSREVRKLNKKISVTDDSFVQVPFDLAHWQKVAAEKYPHGLPKPFSSDPTQWLFNGHPNLDHPAPNRPKDADGNFIPQPSTFILQVALARLCGYQWPRQTGSSFPDCPALGPDGLEKLADDDGIVCLPPINREQPAAARLRALLAAAMDTYDERALLAAAGSKKTNLEDWLRDEFFEQHCALFHQRPFLWHIWDGMKDGFAAIVNYHRLDNATLQKLAYTYLGNWIHTQEADAKADKPGAAERLAAAQSLQHELIRILEGEAPYDIFVRWKPLNKQPVGWHPDLNDGVRLNIRPFLTAKDVGKKGAGLLRSKPNIKWEKNKGKEPQRPKADYPWFWCEQEPDTDPTGGKDFTGHRWNNVQVFREAGRPVAAIRSLSCIRGSRRDS